MKVDVKTVINPSTGTNLKMTVH